MEILIFIVIFVVVIGASMWAKRHQRSNWQAVALEFGLRYVDAGLFDEPSMHGEHKGAAVSVLTEVTGSGKHKSVYTVVEVALTALAPMDLEVYREGFFQKVGKVIGGEDIEVDDADLDAAFIIRAVDRQRVKDLLTNPAVKARLLSAQSKYPSFRLDMGKVRIRQNGRTGNKDKLRGYIRTAVAVANAVEEACTQKPNPTPHPRPQLARAHAAPGDEQPAGLSTVPFGRPAASGAPDDEPTRADAPATAEDDWW